MQPDDAYYSRLEIAFDMLGYNGEDEQWVTYAPRSCDGVDEMYVGETPGKAIDAALADV